MPDLPHNAPINAAIAWCLAWGPDTQPQHPLEKINSWRKAIAQGQTPIDPEWQQMLSEAEALTELYKTNADFSKDVIATFEAQYPHLRDTKIGLVYGGVTKVKSYVFESADLQEARGASALLDRINLLDLPAFFSAEMSDDHRFKQCREAVTYCRKAVREDWLDIEFEGLSKALIPELIVYSTGGNILAFCPAHFSTQLANAIEKRYTTETLTANSCAVNILCRPVEIYYGLLKEPATETLWHDTIEESHKANSVLHAYFNFHDSSSKPKIEIFKQRKNFSELVGKLISQFNHRRGGYDLPTDETSETVRPSRRFPPMFETHPYLLRDDSDIRSAVVKIAKDKLPDEPNLSEPTARKRRVGQIVKRESAESQKWYERSGFQSRWNPVPTTEKETVFQSWVSKFEGHLKDKNLIDQYDHQGRNLFNEQGNIKQTCEETREARSLHEIGASSNGYVGYIYADGNNMGQYIREQVKTPAGYQAFSAHVFEATEKSVYGAIAHHIHPYHYKPNAKSSRQPNQADKDPVWIHPFEIITIGGDDVLLIVPANKAVEVAQSIGENFENILLSYGDRYEIPPDIDLSQQHKAHRYSPAPVAPAKCRLSTSSGVLITAANTPIYYADKIVSQLLKSAKRHLKALKDPENKISYYGGTVDFLVLKAVTMISSNIADFRKSGLTIAPEDRQHILRLYGAPYTLHELKGLIATVRAVKDSDFPKSQMYKIRSLLERGKRTAILNYRYFRVRLEDNKQTLLKAKFEQAWCNASTNEGNLAPWLTVKRDLLEKRGKKSSRTIYETIWRELVDLEPFIEPADKRYSKPDLESQVQSSGSQEES